MRNIQNINIRYGSGVPVPCDPCDPRQDVLAFMENFPTEEERIHDKPFTKLKQDTMKQLKDKGLV